MYRMDWRARQSLISTANFRQQCLAYPLEPCNVALYTVSWSQKEVRAFKGCQGFTVICLTAHALWSRACQCSAWGGDGSCDNETLDSAMLDSKTWTPTQGPLITHIVSAVCDMIHTASTGWHTGGSLPSVSSSPRWRLNIQREMSLPISQTTALYKKWIMTCNNSL